MSSALPPARPPAPNRCFPASRSHRSSDLRRAPLRPAGTHGRSAVRGRVRCAHPAQARSARARFSGGPGVTRDALRPLAPYSGARGILLPPPRGPPALCFGAVARPSRHKRPRNPARANQCPRSAFAFLPLRPSALSAPRPAPRVHPRPVALRGLGWSLFWWSSPGARWAGPGEEPRRPGRWLGQWHGPGKATGPRFATGLRLRLQAGGSLQLGP